LALWKLVSKVLSNWRKAINLLVAGPVEPVPVFWGGGELPLPDRPGELGCMAGPLMGGAALP
jgi:hypothetical protein